MYSGLLRLTLVFGIVFCVLSAQTPSVRHISSNYETIEFEYFGSEIDIELISEDNQEFYLTSFGESKNSVEIGGPDLPVLRDFVEIPFGANPIVVFEDVSYRYEEIDKPIYPVQPPRIKQPDADHPFVYDKSLYAENSWYFSKDAEILDTVISRDSRLALFEVRPVNYNPVTGQLRIMTKANITIELPGASRQRTEDIKRRYSTFYSRSVNEAVVLNPAVYSPLYLPSVDIGLLIISANGAGDTLQKYARWKRRKGFKVDVYELSDIGSSASDIQAFIQNEYDYGDVPPQFVIFVGDAELLPTNSGVHSSGAPTDNHYVTVAGSDFIPDIFHGRWSFTSLAQIHEFMNRNIEYEKFDYSSTAWTNKVCLPSTDDWYWHELAYATQLYAANTHFEPLGYTQIDLINAYHDGAGPSGTAVINAINEGRMLVNYTGHGLTTYFDAPRVTQTNVRNLTNTGAYPFVIGNACITGKFDVAECFAETWIRQVGKGAIAYMGASANTMWHEDDAFARRMYDSTFIADYYFTCGMMMKGLMAVYVGYPARANYYMEIYHVFGDPSVALWFQPPAYLSVTHPETIMPGGGSVVVNVSSGTALQDALVCITNDSDVHDADYTNSSGDAIITLPSGMAVGDTLFVTVTAYNKRPYFGYMLVGGNASTLAYNDHSINDNMTGSTWGDGDGMADSDERIGIDVELRNIGALPAYSVTAVLSTASPYCNIINGSSGYGNISVGSTATNATQFTLDIADNVPNNSEIPLTLIATDSNDSTWTINFSITAFAPVLSIGSHSISGGSEPGLALPGETVNLSIAANNSSVERAISVNGTISTADHYITVTRAGTSYGDINPHDSSTPPVPFRVEISPACPTPHYATINVALEESRGYTETGSIVFMVGNAGFYDDVEAEILGYSSVEVFRSTRRAASGSYSWYFGRPDVFSYRDTMQYLLTTPSIIAPENPELIFTHFLATEPNYDYACVDISTDGGSSWTQIVYYHGQAKRWLLSHNDLSPFVDAGDEFRIRFRLEADNLVHNEGWFIDDILVTNAQSAYIGGGDVSPWTGLAGNEYTFYVNYLSPTGISPTQARVYIDGSPQTMSFVAGNVTDGARYEYSTTLSGGGHSFYFEFIADGETITFPKSGALSGPFVNSSPIISMNVGSNSAGFSHTAETNDDWQWGIPTYGPSAASVPVGNNVWGTILDGEYNDQADSRLMTPVLNLSGITNPFLTFWHWYRFQAPNANGFHDGGNVKISVDGAEPFIIYPQHGYDVNISRFAYLIPRQFGYASNNLGNFWQFECFDLTPWSGEQVTIYFDFGSSSANVEAGWYINDVYILGSITAGMTEPAHPKPEMLEFVNFPNPFNAEVKLSLSLPQSGKVDIQIFDIDGRVVGSVFSGYREAGQHFFNWNAGDLPNAVYLTRCKTQNSTKTIKMLLVK